MQARGGWRGGRLKFVPYGRRQRRGGDERNQANPVVIDDDVGPRCINNCTDDPRPYTWFKTADEILDNLGGSPAQVTNSGAPGSGKRRIGRRRPRR
jgi:hypothetical protein